MFAVVTAICLCLSLFSDKQHRQKSIEMCCWGGVSLWMRGVLQVDLQSGEILVLHGQWRGNLDSRRVHRRPTHRRQSAAHQVQRLSTSTCRQRLRYSRRRRHLQELARLLDARCHEVAGWPCPGLWSSGAVYVLRAARTAVVGFRAGQRATVHHYLRL